jgi:phage tail-like protein
MTVDPELPLVRAFRFEVRLLPVSGKEDPLPTYGAFQDCTGLEIEMDVQDHLEGGRNNAVVRRVGRAKYQPIVLKRGMFQATEGGVADSTLWAWIQDTVDGKLPVRRFNGVVEVLGAGSEVVARWTFSRGLPAKVAGPQLDAKTGGIAIEELHIAHEGLRLELGS